MGKHVKAPDRSLLRPIKHSPEEDSYVVLAKLATCSTIRSRSVQQREVGAGVGERMSGARGFPLGNRH